MSERLLKRKEVQDHLRERNMPHGRDFVAELINTGTLAEIVFSPRRRRVPETALADFIAAHVAAAKASRSQAGIEGQGPLAACPAG